VIAYIKNSVANETYGDLKNARGIGFFGAKNERLRTSEEEINLGLTRALNGFDMMTLEERKVLIENIEQELKNREQN
jgi:hypothetical protein